MPPTQHGQAYKLAPGKWGLRYYDAEGVRRRKAPSLPSRQPSPTTGTSSSRRYAASPPRHPS
jgi:hypothetical protein